MTALIVTLVVVAVIVVALTRTVRVVPQSTAGVVERFGRYHRTLGAGRNVVVPLVDRIRATVDLREQVVSFPPQPVTTRDKLVVSVDLVVRFQVVNARNATYEVANYVTAVEQLGATSLRNMIAEMDLEHTMTAREEITNELREALGKDAGDWGLRVNRVELKAIDPPASMQETMENERRAERERKASLSAAESEKQAAILSAEGNKQAAVLRARGEAEAAVQRAKGEAEAIQILSRALQDAGADQRLLAHEYLQALPRIADGNSNTVVVAPSDMSQILQGLGGVVDLSGHGGAPGTDGPSQRPGGTATPEE